QGLARRHHYALLLAGGAPDDLSALWKDAPDGLMVVGSDFCPAGLDVFLKAGKPVTQIGWGVLRPGVSRVAMDQAAGLGGLVDYLAGLGHRRFGWLGSAQAPNRRREALLRGALRQRGLALAGAARLDLPPAEAGAAGMTHLLARSARCAPTAVIAADDVMALGALRALHAAGRWAPEAISLAGIDDIPAARLAIPALTTLRQPVRRMIDAAFRNLLGRDGPPAPETLIAPELIVRESCGNPLTT
ncbi:MAG: LacI family transcriptional regulator, partial [Candidatus Marinimicrobia bacterium]|nr:LacI family transcriptional regulator [Candidatus Neomarinimicrobiota bacterium]